jgi:penicillin-binding protein 1B
MNSPTKNRGANSDKNVPNYRASGERKSAATSASNGKKPSSTRRKSAPKMTKAAAPSANKLPGTRPPSPPTKKSAHWRRLLVFGGLAAILLFGIWLVYLDAKVRAEFDGKKWALPAKVYARPLTIYPGKSLSAEQLRAELHWADYTRSSGAHRVGSYDERGERWFIYRRAFPFWDGAEATRRLIIRIHDGHITELADEQGDLALVRLEPQYIGGIFPAHNEDRELIQLSEAPAQLVAALVVTEDKAFFDHLGVSARGIARAMMANLRAGDTVQGGSTLTQQLVKNFFLTNERSLQRKIQEALMALLLERHYSKEEILQAYLNEVYLGQAGRRAIHGFGLASRFYFGKPLNELQTSEIATLVGLVKGASFYNPRRHPERAKERRDLVLGLMAENGIISTGERILAQGQPLATASPRRAGQREYPAFLELAKDQLQRNYRLTDLQSEGLHIFTTLDPWIQHAVEDAAANQLSLLERRQPKLRDQLETAAVITSVDGGEVRALLGSRKAEFFGFNRAIAAQRSIGSLAKPAVYLAALDSGRYHWGSLINDQAVTVAGPSGQLWQPKNYDHQSHGEVPMVDALAYSYNQATARLGMQVGLQKVVDEFAKLGVEQPLPPYPSLLLGAISMSPLDVARVRDAAAHH